MNRSVIDGGHELLPVAQEAAKEAGALLTTDQRDVVQNLERDVKVAADLLLHEFLLNELAITGIPVFSEEGDREPESVPTDLRWILDPLDGSVNFSRGVPFFCVSIGLWNGSEPVLGVVHDPLRAETYSGLVGAGAWLNGDAIAVRTHVNRSEAILCTGFPVATEFSTDALSSYVARVQRFKKVRLLGSAALSLALVASGRVDAYVEEGIALWDVAAGLALVRAAGGAFRTAPYGSDGRLTVMAANTVLMKSLDPS